MIRCTQRSSCFHQAKKLFMTHDGQIEPWERLIAGSLAGIASQSSIYPMEVRYLSYIQVTTDTGEECGKSDINFNWIFEKFTSLNYKK